MAKGYRSRLNFSEVQDLPLFWVSGFSGSEQIANLFREAIHERNTSPTAIINKTS